MYHDARSPECQYPEVPLPSRNTMPLGLSAYEIGMRNSSNMCEYTPHKSQYFWHKNKDPTEWHSVAQLVEALLYTPEGRGLDSR